MFDSTIPIEEITELVTIIREGKLQDDIPHALKLALWIAGSTLETFFESMSVTQLSSHTLDSVCQNILNVAPAQLENDEVGTESISPELIMAIVRLATLLLAGRK